MDWDGIIDQVFDEVSELPVFDETFDREVKHIGIKTRLKLNEVMWYGLHEWKVSTHRLVGLEVDSDQL